ncbi:MAG: acyl-ACP--UDP-N-acetylglucosamine O-acyltransferase [Nitrococcus sp.]|nr:acyl-ACP--UDP-N-acetylglucosamine O-acyltransferase [Nitrococcus sp.]
MIHPRAVIHPAAELASEVEVGPYAVIGPDVEIENGTWIGPHAVIQGPTRIGCNNRIFQFASIGDIPQDKKFRGERSWLEIGVGNTIREYVSINRGTEVGGGITRVGNDNWIMAYCHIAHDCRVGNATVFANNASLAGHVVVDDYSILSGFSLVHQFSRLGQHCFLAFGAHIDRDVPPYVMAAGQRATPRGINVNGLQRHGFAKGTVQALKRAYKTLYSSGLRLDEALAALDEIGCEVPEVATFSAFIRGSQRGIIR